MKKYLLSFAVLLMGTALFTACSDDDDNPQPEPVAVDVSDGVFIVSSGNKRSAIDGSLTYYDYTTKKSTLEAFKAANGRVLGATANDILVYGSKAYIVVDGENTIEVVDKQTLKSVKQIKTTDLLGDPNGTSPRHIAAKDGNIYVSFFGDANGYVAAIDTASYALTNSYEVGSKPEGLDFVGDDLYVVNSDYGYGNASITKINVATNKVETITNELIGNPVAIKAIGTDLYILDSGSYDYNDNYKQKNAGVRKFSTTANTIAKAVDATAMASDGKKIYVINAPYGFYNADGSAVVEYKVYDVASAQTGTFLTDGVFSPVCIGVDPVSGDVFIASASKDPDTGYANSALPGYVNHYDAQGQLVSTFQCGPGACAIKFNTGVKYE